MNVLRVCCKGFGTESKFFFKLLTFSSLILIELFIADRMSDHLKLIILKANAAIIDTKLDISQKEKILNLSP